MVTVGNVACGALEMQCIIQRGVSVISVVSVMDCFKQGGENNKNTCQYREVKK